VIQVKRIEKTWPGADKFCFEREAIGAKYLNMRSGECRRARQIRTEDRPKQSNNRGEDDGIDGDRPEDQGGRRHVGGEAHQRRRQRARHVAGGAGKPSRQDGGKGRKYGAREMQSDLP
jgi:hypothetical protein